MRKSDVLTFSSELYTTAFNHGKGLLNKHQADLRLYDSIGKFIDKLRKDTGYQEDRGIIHRG